MSSLRAERQDWAAGVRSRLVRASMNYAVGVCMAGAWYSLWWTLRLVEAYALFHSSNYRDGPRPRTAVLVRARGPKVPITAGKQRRTASDNSEVLGAKPRFSAPESDISAVIFGKNSENSENRTSRPVRARALTPEGKVNACNFSVKAGRGSALPCRFGSSRDQIFRCPVGLQPADNIRGGRDLPQPWIPAFAGNAGREGGSRSTEFLDRDAGAVPDQMASPVFVMAPRYSQIVSVPAPLMGAG